jgi:Tol biopolymer transport system component
VAVEFGERAKHLTPPEDVGRPLITGNVQMNMAPAVSPDGRYVAFLSRRDIFTIDLYLADAHTGEVIEKLASSNSDAHFDALRFSESSGSWSPDGRELAFVVYKNGMNRIAVLDVRDRRIVKDMAVKGVEAIQTLAWSPDGSRIAVGGTHGGFADIDLYDLGTGEVTRLTDGPYADFQPAWSPDGAMLAFATDRGAGTDFAVFAHGPIKLGLMDIESREIELISMHGATKHINPQFSPDGRSLYLIADPEGISDIYRYSFADSSFYRITSVATGISGLGTLSPALSIAGRTGDLVFSVFERGDYNIYGLADTPRGVLFSTAAQEADSTLTHPTQGEESTIVSKYLADPREGLPTDLRDTVLQYSPSFKLLYLAPVSAGVAVGQSGSYLVGGTSFLFGDLLGDHVLQVSVTASGSLDYLGGQVVYENLKRRLDWGAAAGHVPYSTALLGYGVDTVTVNGQPVPAEYIELVRQRIYMDTAVGLAEYPFSTNRRLEMSAGYTRLSYHEDMERISSVGGTTIDEGVKNLPSPPALDIFQTSLAYVGDYSFFGIGSPARGKRYRFEMDPTFGSLTYLGAVADYRHYFFARPWTFAMRGLFMGRYLKDAEDSRLSPLFLGDESLVRGYSLDSFSLSDCANSDDPTRCPELDRLIGSRIGVFNAELRLPVFGPEGYGLVNVTFLPTELAAFFDAGVAWTRSSAPVLELKTRSRLRIPVFSTGMAARFRVLGSLVLQVYYAYPFERPEKGGHFRFVIGSGW